jgi:hypothetical protein
MTALYAKQNHSEDRISVDLPVDIEGSDPEGNVFTSGQESRMFRA